MESNATTRAVAALLATVMMGAVACGCGTAREDPPKRQVPGGDPDRGRDALATYGCGGCHAIPGVEHGRGLVAPPLDDFADRAFVAGIMSNNSENLVRWIVDPRGIDPRTAMPDLGVPEQDARDMAAYLYTLRAH